MRTRCGFQDFEAAIQNKREGGLCTYTQLWERSLSQRFSGATFIPLEPDQRLQNGRYQVLRQLAFGGFAAVYLARNQDGGFVVLKESTFPQTGEVEQKAGEWFKRECELLSKLDHPNIVRVHDYFLEGGRHYLVMQHVEGIDLNRLVMKNGPQSAQAACDFARQIASALKYLHDQSSPIVHRDVTPDNLLLRPNGTLTLVDFGAAKEIVSSFTGTIIGKRSSMAPEQFKGHPSPKSDVYSLGATIAYLVTGKQPEPLTQSDLTEYIIVTRPSLLV